MGLEFKRGGGLGRLAAVAWLAAVVIGAARADVPVDSALLVRINGPEAVRQAGLPSHAILRDAAGVEYALVIAASSRLGEAGLAWQLVDCGATPDKYLLALPVLERARAAAAGRFDVVHDDGVQWVVRLREAQDADTLAGIGFALGRLSQAPMAEPRSLPPAVQSLLLEPFASNAWIGAAMTAVQSNDLVSLVSQLTGEEAVAAGGDIRTISSRYTASGAAIGKAVQFVHEYLGALGLNPVRPGWSASGYTGYNVVGTQAGTTASNEYVLITAHLDNMPPSGRAPGADDNASGSAAVLAAASVLSQYRFERSIRYVVFTGEEQGLRGSAAYAAVATNAGDNIVAVLNLDMISWDGDGTPTLLLYTRNNGTPAGSNDMALAEMFTNVVSAYGLQDQLLPLIHRRSDMRYSDHASFWDQGYASILAIEYFNVFDPSHDDGNPYYHQVTDTLAHMNLPYFTAFTRASVGTVAHLARVTEARPFDAVRVVSGDWRATNRNFGATLLHARHEPGAGEGTDAADVTWAAAPLNTNDQWLKIATRPSADELAQDCRGADSETLFRAALSSGSKVDGTFACTNTLRFFFLAPPDTNRLYTIRVTVAGAYTADSNAFLCVTNGRDLARGGGFISLPALRNLTNGAVYGTCDIGTRFQDYSATGIVVRPALAGGTSLTLRATAQSGACVIDDVEVSTNLLMENPWKSLALFTNSMTPAADNFESGWGEIRLPADDPLGDEPGSVFLRIRRRWLSP